MVMKSFISDSFEQTKKIACDLAKTFVGGEVVLLDGDLGAGKTVFTKGIVNALSNGKIIAVSPTFVIVYTPSSATSFWSS